MKNTIVRICAALAVLSLAGCGITEEPPSDSSSEAAKATTVSSGTSATTKANEVTTASVAAVTTAATEAITEPVTTEMDGTGGDIENEMYRLSGWWETSDRTQCLYIKDNTFTFSRNGDASHGYLTHTDKDLPNSFALTEDESGLSDGRYIRRDTDSFARLIFTEDGKDTEFIYSGDLIPSLLYSERGTYTYNGIKYTDPVTIELLARADISNVKLLKLTFVEIDDLKAPLYDGEVVLELPSLAKGASFTPMIEIPGDIPAYGISYEDEHGGVHYFDIALSGRDGSIVLTSFKNIREFQ